MDAGFFKGTTTDQDSRFSDKTLKLMKQMKFSNKLDTKVDIHKINIDSIKPWINQRLTELLGFEDDVVVSYVYNQLETRYPNPKEIQVNLTGFLNAKNSRTFLAELWDLLISASENQKGVPVNFIEAELNAIKNTKVEEEKIRNTLKIEAIKFADQVSKTNSAENKESYQKKQQYQNNDRNYRRNRNDDGFNEGFDNRSRDFRENRNKGYERRKEFDRRSSREKRRSRTPNRRSKSPPKQKIVDYNDEPDRRSQNYNRYNKRSRSPNDRSFNRDNYKRDNLNRHDNFNKRYDNGGYNRRNYDDNHQRGGNFDRREQNSNFDKEKSKTPRNKQLSLSPYKPEEIKETWCNFSEDEGEKVLKKSTETKRDSKYSRKSRSRSPKRPINSQKRERSFDSSNSGHLLKKHKIGSMYADRIERVDPRSYKDHIEKKKSDKRNINTNKSPVKLTDHSISPERGTWGKESKHNSPISCKNKKWNNERKVSPDKNNNRRKSSPTPPLKPQRRYNSPYNETRRLRGNDRQMRDEHHNSRHSPRPNDNRRMYHNSQSRHRQDDSYNDGDIRWAQAPYGEYRSRYRSREDPYNNSRVQVRGKDDFNGSPRNKRNSRNHDSEYKPRPKEIDDRNRNISKVSDVNFKDSVKKRKLSQTKHTDSKKKRKQSVSSDSSGSSSDSSDSSSDSTGSSGSSDSSSSSGSSSSSSSDSSIERIMKEKRELSRKKRKEGSILGDDEQILRQKALDSLKRKK